MDDLAAWGVKDLMLLIAWCEPNEKRFKFAVREHSRPMIISKRSIFVWIAHLQRLHNQFQMRDIFTAAHLDNSVMSKEETKIKKWIVAMPLLLVANQYYFFILTKFDSKHSSACMSMWTYRCLLWQSFLIHGSSFFSQHSIVGHLSFSFVDEKCYRHFNPIFFDIRVMTFTFARCKWTDRICWKEVHKL